MPEPLARDEDRAADVEAEGVVLERRPVPLAHQEADQALVGLVHLVLAAGEADPRAVDDREVVGHRVVEPDEAVVEDRDRCCRVSLRRRDRHDGECSGAVCRHFRLVLPVLEARLLPGRHEARRVPAPLRRALRDRRAEHDRLPAPARGAVRALGRADAARLPVRAEAARALALRLSATFAERVRPARRAARSDPRRSSPQPATTGCSTLVLGSLDPALQLAFDFRHESWDGIEATCRGTPCASTSSRPRRRSATCASASRRTPTRRLARLGGAAPAAARRRRSGLLLLQARGRADRAGVRAAAARAARPLSSTICSTANRSSSSVLKKCGPKRRPTSGRQSQMTPRAAQLRVPTPLEVGRPARRPCRRAGPGRAGCRRGSRPRRAARPAAPSARCERRRIRSMPTSSTMS